MEKKRKEKKRVPDACADTVALRPGPAVHPSAFSSVKYR